MFMGDRIIVEPARQPLRRDPYGGPPPPPRGYGGPRDYDYGGPPPPPRRAPRQPRRGMYRIIVFNLPPGTSWQDLKDVGREHGSITFSDINPSRPDEGAIEYDNADDYERALARIEGFELRGYKLRVEPDSGAPPPMPPRRELSPPPRGGYDYPDERPGDRYRDERPPPPSRGDRWDDDRRESRWRDERPPPPPREPVREAPAPEHEAPLAPAPEAPSAPEHEAPPAPEGEAPPAPPAEDTPADAPPADAPPADA